MLVYFSSGLCGQSSFGQSSLSSFYPVNQDFSLPKDKKMALSRKISREWRNYKRPTRELSSFFRMLHIQVFGAIPHHSPVAERIFPPWPPDSKAWRTFCLIKAGKHGRGKKPKVWQRSQLMLKTFAFRWWRVISGVSRLKAVVFAKWYSWKVVENRVALDRSNYDPAGRAEQLKQSPGERWELLTATEGLYSGTLSRPRADENIAGNTKKH